MPSGMRDTCFLQKLFPLLLVYGDNRLVFLLMPRGKDEPFVLAWDLRRGQTYTFDKMAGLAEAKENYPLGKLEKRIRQTDLLTLDEMSYVGF